MAPVWRQFLLVEDFAFVCCRGQEVPRVSLALAPALVFYGGSDVPHAYLEREGVIVVHAAQPLHERRHVPHGAVGQGLNGHERAVADLGEAGNRARLHPGKVTHAWSLPSARGGQPSLSDRPEQRCGAEPFYPRRHESAGQCTSNAPSRLSSDRESPSCARSPADDAELGATRRPASQFTCCTPGLTWPA